MKGDSHDRPMLHDGGERGGWHGALTRPTIVNHKDPSQQPAKLKMVGGSASDDWNNVLVNQTIQTLWLKACG